MKYFYTQQKAFYNDPCCDAPTVPNIQGSHLIGLEVYNVQRHPLSGYTFNLQGHNSLFYAPWRHYLAEDTPGNRKLFEAIRRDRLDLVAKERELDWYREAIGKRETELVYIGEQHV